MRFHPASQILIWCVLAIMLQMLPPQILLLISSAILFGAFLLSRRKFMLLLRRTRWVMFSLLLIYAYSVPGHALTDLFGSFSPTVEGLSDGALQLMRLLASLAALSILLERLHRELLISGLYTLSAPLQLFGLSRERLAIRLALTLHYAEVAVLREASDWKLALHGLLEMHEEPTKEMDLLRHGFGLADTLLLVVCTITIWLMIR